LAAAEAEQKRRDAIAREQRSLQAALDQEEAFLSELEDREQLASMQALIKSYVEQNWSRPPTARKGMQAVLKIELLPTGEVKSVTVVESSRDSAFDRSAEQAVYRAGPFRELIDLKPQQKEAFRAFNLVFKPEDIQ
jgi:colicin import membrane protein